MTVLAVDDVGVDFPVLLLHSGLADRRMWAAQVPALARSHRLLLPDLPGFGESVPEPGPNDPVAALVALLDDRGVDRAGVVGSSVGGRIALELAGRSPERVERLVLLCPAYPWAPQDDDAAADALAFAAEEGRLLAAERLGDAIELNLGRLLGPGADDAARDLLRRMHRRSLELSALTGAWEHPPSTVRTEPDLAGLRMPVTVLRGGLDWPYFRAAAAHVAQTVPGASLVDLPWAAHLPALERPDETTRLLVELLGP